MAQNLQPVRGDELQMITFGTAKVNGAVDGQSGFQVCAKDGHGSAMPLLIMV
jgi:hypothetical protein